MSTPKKPAPKKAQGTKANEAAAKRVAAAANGSAAKDKEPVLSAAPGAGPIPGPADTITAAPEESSKSEYSKWINKANYSHQKVNELDRDIEYIASEKARLVGVPSMMSAAIEMIKLDNERQTSDRFRAGHMITREQVVVEAGRLWDEFVNESLILLKKNRAQFCTDYNYSMSHLPDTEGVAWLPRSL